MDNTIEVLQEEARWHTRDVKYWKGPWESLESLIPEFCKEDYKASEKSPPNPYLKNIIRLPLKKFEQSIPVGIVSNTYTLAQHRDVANKCIEGIKNTGVEISALQFELGLTELGEWMNFRIYFPAQFDHVPKEGDKLKLRLECFNSVDGSSRLVILLGWFRLVCSNGMIIGETKTEVRDIHNSHLDLEQIPKIVSGSMNLISADKNRLISWNNHKVDMSKIENWVNEDVSKSWGKKAACRIYHICKGGKDVEYENPFAEGKPTEKPVKVLCDVPGSAVPAKTLYDVSQVLSWVGSNRNNAEEKISWQTDIPKLINKLGS